MALPIVATSLPCPGLAFTRHVPRRVVLPFLLLEASAPPFTGVVQKARSNLNSPAHYGDMSQASWRGFESVGSAGQLLVGEAAVAIMDVNLTGTMLKQIGHDLLSLACRAGSGF